MKDQPTLSEELFGEIDSQLDSKEDMQIAHNSKIENLVKDYRDVSLKVQMLENQLKDAKAAKTELEHVAIPDAVAETGFSAVKLPSGTTVTIKPYVNARMSKLPNGKIDEKKQELLHKYLVDTGNGGMVKHQFIMFTNDNDMIQVLKETCEEQGIDYDYVVKAIRWNTFEAWVKEQLENGKGLPTDLFELYVGSIAVVK